MLRNWVVAIEADHNHLRVETVGAERIGAAWVCVDNIPSLDMICDSSEDGRQLLKDALVHLIEVL